MSDPVAVLLEKTLPAEFAGPGALDARIGAWLTPAQAQLVERRRADVLARVTGRDDAVSVLLLGELGAVEEVPRLVHLFIDADDTYGWETSRPCSLDHEQHPLRHAIEASLAALTGKRIEELIVLGDADLKRLRAAAADDDDDALYVLSRLRPDVLAVDLMRKFNLSVDRTERFMLALQLEHVLVGREAGIVGDRRGRRVVRVPVVNLHEMPEIFEIKNDGNRIVAAALRESGSEVQ